MIFIIEKNDFKIKEKLKTEAIKIYNSNGRLYKVDWFNLCDRKNIKSPKEIYKYFNSFNDFLYYCNLPINKLRNNITKEDVDKEIIRIFNIAKLLNKPFNDSLWKKYSNIKKYLYKYYSTVSKMLNYFKDIYEYNEQFNVTEEKVILDLLEIHNNCTESFNLRYYNKHSKYGSYYIKKFFGSYQNAIEKFNLTSNVLPTPTKEEYFKELKEIYNKFGFISINLIAKESIYKGKGIRYLYNEFGGYINALNELNLTSRHNNFKCANQTLIYASEILNEPVQLEKTWDWLKNPETKYNLRVDGYFEKHNLIIEYNGRQHYEFLEYYHKNIEGFNKSLKLFELKKKLIKEHNINLIEFSYKDNITKENVKEKLIKYL